MGAMCGKNPDDSRGPVKVSIDFSAIVRTNL